MSNAEFDRHASQYGAMHQHNITASGEEPSYFAEYKMRDFGALANQAGLPLNGRYLDFGSGVGASVSHFLKYMPGARLVCADVSSESLALSQYSHGNAVEYSWMMDGKLGFDGPQFDGAFACCVFHHIEPSRHLDALADLKRVIKPGGLLMIYEHNPFNPLTVRAVRTCPFDENAVLMTARQIERSAIAAGFLRYRRDYRVFFPAGLAALRPLENRLRWCPVGAQYFVALRA